MRTDERLKIIYETIAPTITRTDEAWKDYLRFGATVYKHQFDNALLVYAQNPRATMLATFDTWKSDKLRRSINKGTKGIAVCEYANANLTIKHLYDITQTNGRIVPVVWKLDDELRQGLVNRLSYSYDIKSNGLIDCIEKITATVIADTVDDYLQEFENDVKDHFLGMIPQDGLIVELTETIYNSCVYFIAHRCGETADVNLPTISHFDTIPLVARLGYTVTELSKGILLEIERNVKILENERRAKNEQRTHEQQRASRTPERLTAGELDRGRGSAPRQVRQNGDGASTPNQPPKVFTFEDAGRAYEPDVSGGRGSVGADRKNNGESAGERPDTRNRGHFGENPPLQPIQADSGGNRTERSSADTEITEPEREPQGSFSLGDYVEWLGKLYMLAYLDEDGYIIRSLDDKSTYHDGNIAQLNEFIEKRSITRVYPERIDKLFGYVADEIIWSDGEEYIIGSFDTSAATLINLIDNTITKTIPILEACEILWHENTLVRDGQPRLFSAPQIWYTPDKNIPYREGDIVRALFTSARLLQITDQAVRYIIPEEADKGVYEMERSRFEENLENGVYRTITSGDTVLKIDPKAPAEASEPPPTTEQHTDEPPDDGSFFMPGDDDKVNQTAEPEGTPFWREYNAFLYKYPDSIVFRRLGDFYEVMGWDAKTVADEFDLTLISRDAGLSERVPMIGVPAHTLDKYVDELVRKNYHVVIADAETVTERKPEEAKTDIPAGDYHSAPAAYRNSFDMILIEGTGSAESKQVIYDFFTAPDNEARPRSDAIDLLKKEYGIFLANGTLESEGIKHWISGDDGITATFNDGYILTMTWPIVQLTIDRLILENRYLEQKEQSGIDDYAVPNEPESYGRSISNRSEQLTLFDLENERDEPTAWQQSDYPRFNEYLKLFTGIVVQDEAYRAAYDGSGNFDRIIIECRAALERSIVHIGAEHEWFTDTYRTDAEFAKRFAQRLLEESYPIISKETRERVNVPEPAATPRARTRTPNDASHRNFKTFNNLFPQIVDGTYREMLFESNGFEPLTLARVGGNQYSIMHTYQQNGDTMFDPYMTVEIDAEAQTVQALSYELSSLSVYQDVYASGNQNIKLQRELNSFLSDWLRNIGQQGFMPSKAISLSNGKDIVITFDSGEPKITDEKESPVRLTNELINSHNSQLDLQILALIDDNRVGELLYTVFEGTPRIENIEVYEDYRRRGIGSMMVRYLAEQFPGVEIEWSLMTGDGAAFHEAVTYKVENKEYTEAQDRITEISGQLAVFESKYADSYIPEDVDDEWNDLENEKYDLENRLAELKPTKTFIRLDDDLDGEVESAVSDEEDYTEEETDGSGGTITLPEAAPLTQNYRYSVDDNLYPAGAKAKYQNNIAAIRLLKRLETEKRTATPDEQKILAGYVGWGGLANAFNENNSTWSNEYKELRLLLSDDEYNRARSSTLTAYYTEQRLIECIYKGLSNLGFNDGKGRRILDPAMGTGNFFSVLPDSLQDAKLYGVELDSITGRIAKKLYPNADISVTGYENTDFEDNSFDVALGNIPFNSIKVLDRRYDDLDFLIHDYFIAKTIDKVKPGGVIAFITSKGTMDKNDSTVREYIAQRADLLGAVRLPNNAFKALAGTEVTADIIFLKKRETELADDDEYPDWVNTASRQPDYMPLNRYFINNPEMILGQMKWDSRMYGNQDGTACIAPDGQDLYGELEKAMSYLKGIFKAEPDAELTPDDEEYYEREHEKAPDGTKNFTYLVKDDKIYFVEKNLLVPMEFTGMAAERIKGMCDVKAALLDVIAVQSRDYEYRELEEAQRKLNAAYDAFIGKYGFINSAANTRAFKDDDQLPLLCSIEKWNKQNETYDKETIFTKATIKSYRRPHSADTVADALMLSINYYQKVNIPYIADLCNQEPDEVIKELGGKIYLNPLNYYGNYYEGWEIDEEYLSGNVKRKLEYAALKAQEHPELFSRNVDALKEVQPEPLTPNDISFRVGTKWIPLEYYQQFMHETFGTKDKAVVTLEYNKFTSKWFINGKMSEKTNTLVNNTFGTSRMNAYEIFEDSLNLQNVIVRDSVEETNEQGKKVIRYVTNPQQTAIAREKQEQIREKFGSWLFRDADRAQILVDLYNDRFNVYRPRSYDGSYLQISGLNEEYKLMSHQLDFVARAAHTGSALNGHVVGGGKTLALIASGMYMKEIGAINKPVFVVPNNIIGQWANDFYRFFPGANVLVTTEKDFAKKNRQKFISKIAMGEYDAVLITQSQFEKVPVSLERQMDMAQSQIREINWAISEAKKRDGQDWSIKDMERLAYNLETRMARLAANWKKDEIIDFENLGIDFMFVDEAHAYKNGFIYSKIRGVAGVGQSSSQRAMDMLQKCQYLQETHNGRGVVFATGTPISNSLSELFIMQRYLQPDVLRELDSINFDDWVSNFAEVVTALEITPEGSGYRLKSRFAKFFNLPELMNAFALAADIKTGDMLDLKTPEIEGGKAEIVVSELSTFQKRIMSILSDRAMKVRNREVKPHIDNMLSITNDARIMSADARMLIPSAPGTPNSKINQCADNIYAIWQNTAEKRLTQITFSDIGTPKKNQFNVYDELRRQLIERGIPANEIEFIHNAKSDDERQKFFDRMKDGELRLLMGSTQKLGTGANVQDKLYTVHHLDCPWRPSDIEQRDGRILRQGNDNPSVRLYRYITKGSFDSYLWQIQEQKLKFINQVITGRAITRDCEDLDETILTAAQIKAMANGNPFVAEKMEIDNEVTTLRLLKSNWQSERVTYKNNIEVNYPQKITSYEKGITLSNEDISVWGENKDGDFKIELEGIVYDDRVKAAEAFAAIRAVRGENLRNSIQIGRYRGFELHLTREWYAAVLELRGRLKYTKDLGESTLGNITRIENLFDEIPKTLKKYEEQLTDTQKQLEVAKAEIDKPFEHEERLGRLITRQNQLNMELEFKELQSKPDEKNVQAAFVKENFALLEAFAPEILYNNRNYMCFVSDGYSDFILQRVAADIIKMAFYYESGNQRLRDPEVILKLNMDDRTLIPVSYNQDTMFVRQNTYDKNGNLDEKLLSDLDSFIHDWLTDIGQQGYELSPEKEAEAETQYLDMEDCELDMDYLTEDVEVSCGVEI